MSAGFIAVANRQVAIARPGDWNDVLNFSSQAEKFGLLTELKRLVDGSGATRTPAVDLYRQRLHELRVHLNQMH